MYSKINVIVKEPGKQPYQRMIENTSAALRELVGGHLESCTVEADMVIICNEEGRLLNLPHNCEYCGVDFVGTIVLCGFHGEYLTDFPLSIETFRELAPTLFGES